MLARIIFTTLIFLGALVESTILPFPFVFLLSAILFIFFEGVSSFLITLFGALFFDALALNHLGYTPLFLFSFIFVILLLENVFSAGNSIFLGVSLVSGVFLYQYLSSYPFSFLLYLMLILAVSGYVILERRTIKRKASGPVGPLARRENINAKA